MSKIIMQTNSVYCSEKVRMYQNRINGPLWLPSVIFLASFIIFNIIPIFLELTLNPPPIVILTRLKEICEIWFQLDVEVSTPANVLYLNLLTSNRFIWPWPMWYLTLIQWLLTLTHDLWPPCCTTQPGGAQCRSVVHNVVLYPKGGAQQVSQTQTDRWKDRKWCIKAHHA